jgi:superfamily II DNA/RNA helicase
VRGAWRRVARGGTGSAACVGGTKHAWVQRLIRRSAEGYSPLTGDPRSKQRQSCRLSALTGSVCTGVAWHHAGLTRDEKELVERAYLRGGVRVLCCTSTLAAGVNLPARRVLFNQPVRFAGNRSVLIDSTSYRQMAGRAGRKGLDEVGESILVVAPSRPQLLVSLLLISARNMPFSDHERAQVCPARPNTKELAPERLRSLLTQSPRMLRSGLSDEHNDGVASARTSGVYAPSTKPEQSRRRLMLEAVASGRVRSPKQIAEFCKCTLLMALHQQQGSTKETINKAVYAPIKAALEWLGQNNLIESVENGTVSTAMQTAVFATNRPTVSTLTSQPPLTDFPAKDAGLCVCSERREP